MPNTPLTASVNIGSLANGGTVPFIYFPAGYGDITILDAQTTATGSAGVVGLKLITMTDANPPVLNGTVGGWGGTFAAGTITYGAGSVFEATLSAPRIDSGQWLAVKETSTASPGTTLVNITYVYGVLSNT